MKNIAIKLMLFFITVSLFTSCGVDETENLFDKSPSDRLKDRENSLRKVLKSSEYGWKLVYFTDESTYGGFSFVFRFIDDKRVEMLSDFPDKAESKISEYSIDLGNTTQLTFSTKNYIHVLSDSNYGIRGKGMKGSFEFLYIKTEGDEIIFKANKDYKKVKFIKASKDDWDNLTAKKIATKKIFESTNPTKPFKSLVIGDKKYNFEFDKVLRYSSAYNSTYKDDNNVKFGVSYTSSGVIIRPSIFVEGKEVSEFVYDSASGDFIASDSPVLTKITNVDVPSAPYLGYEKLKYDVLQLNNKYAPIQNSEGFNKVYSLLEEAYAPYNLKIEYIAFLDLKLESDTGMFIISTTLGDAYIPFKKEIKDHKVYLTIDGDLNEDTKLFVGLYKPIVDVVFDPEGLYVRQTGTLEKYTGTKIFTITSSSNPSMTMGFYSYNF